MANFSLFQFYNYDLLLKIKKMKSNKAHHDKRLLE